MAAYLWADYLGQYIPELHKTLRSILMYGSKAAYIKTIDEAMKSIGGIKDDKLEKSITAKVKAFSAASPSLSDLMTVSNWEDEDQAIYSLILRYANCGCHNLFRKFVSQLSGSEIQSIFSQNSLGFECMQSSIDNHNVDLVRALIDASVSETERPWGALCPLSQ